MIIFASKTKMAAIARHILTLNPIEKSLKVFSQKLIELKQYMDDHWMVFKNIC